MKIFNQAQSDFFQAWGLDTHYIDSGWMIKWIEMCEHYPNLGLADELEQIASFDTRDEAYIC